MIKSFFARRRSDGDASAHVRTRPSSAEDGEQDKIAGDRPPSVWWQGQPLSASLPVVPASSVSSSTGSAIVGQNCRPSPRFEPLAGIPPTTTPTPVVQGRIPAGASILILKQPWLRLILEGKKQLEVRGTSCRKDRGTRIYLALSGAGGVVHGSVEFVACHGPLSAAEYARRASQHCVAGSTLPYETTYGWEVRAPERFAEPVWYPQRQGCVVWAKME